MFDEKDTTRHIHRGARKDPDRTVEVDSSAFFAPETARPVTPPPSKKPPRQNSSPARPPQKPGKKKGSGSKFGSFLLVLQAILSVAAFVQLCRTRMLPALYLVIIAALLALFWLLVKRCQEYRTPGRVSRVFSVFLCAALALGCVWAQQGLAALGNVTSGLLTGAEANKITKEPFVIYLSGVDNRGELTEKARSDVNILAVVNPATKRVALINTPRDYYVNLANSESTVYSKEISFENAKDNFKLLLGMSLDEDIAILFDNNIPTVDVNINDAVKYALDQRMEIRQKQITLEQDVFSIIRTKAESEFKGDLSVRVGMDALAGKVKNMYDKPTDNEEIGVTLTIPIFDWGAKKAKVKSSQLAMESDEISLEEQKKEIVIDVRQICRNLPTLIRQIEIKKKSIENAERTYEINLEKYRNGNLTGMDLQQFQNQLTTAKQDYTSAIISYKIELLNLKIQTLWDFETHKSYLPVDLLK